MLLLLLQRGGIGLAAFLVLAERAIVAEPLLTHRAAEGLLAGVESSMNDHLVLPAERFAAKLALEPLSLVMFPQVGPQCRSRFVRFYAKRTVVLAHLGVFVLNVNLQS